MSKRFDQFDRTEPTFFDKMLRLTKEDKKRIQDICTHNGRCTEYSRLYKLKEIFKAISISDNILDIEGIASLTTNAQSCLQDYQQNHNLNQEENNHGMFANDHLTIVNFLGALISDLGDKYLELVSSSNIETETIPYDSQRNSHQINNNDNYVAAPHQYSHLDNPDDLQYGDEDYQGRQEYLRLEEEVKRNDNEDKEKSEQLMPDVDIDFNDEEDINDEEVEDNWTCECTWVNTPDADYCSDCGMPQGAKNKDVIQQQQAILLAASRNNEEKHSQRNDSLNEDGRDYDEKDEEPQYEQKEESHHTNHTVESIRAEPDSLEIIQDFFTHNAYHPNSNIEKYQVADRISDILTDKQVAQLIRINRHYQQTKLNNGLNLDLTDYSSVGFSGKITTSSKQYDKLYAETLFYPVRDFFKFIADSFLHQNTTIELDQSWDDILSQNSLSSQRVARIDALKLTESNSQNRNDQHHAHPRNIQRYSGDRFSGRGKGHYVVEPDHAQQDELRDNAAAYNQQRMQQAASDPSFFQRNKGNLLRGGIGIVGLIGLVVAITGMAQNNWKFNKMNTLTIVGLVLLLLSSLIYFGYKGLQRCSSCHRVDDDDRQQHEHAM